jgi:hypothetical protein
LAAVFTFLEKNKKNMNIKKLILLAICCFSINVSMCGTDYLALLEKISHKGLGVATLAGGIYCTFVTRSFFLKAYKSDWIWRENDKDPFDDELFKRNKSIISGTFALALAGMGFGSSYYFLNKKS